MKKPLSRAWFLLLLPILFLLAALVYQIPFVNQRLSWRVDDLKTRLVYFINPPDQAVFIPSGDTPVSTPPILALQDTQEPTP